MRMEEIGKENIMRFFTPSAALAILIATPGLAASTTASSSLHSIHTKWEEHKADRALNHLSEDGQYAMVDILQAKHILDSGQATAALPILHTASKRLVAAGNARKKFIAAEDDLHPAPQHPVSASHTALTAQATWIPVGGEFIVGEELAPEKKTAVATANSQLKSGQRHEVVETMKVVGEDTDFIVALAPLEQTQKAINQAIDLAKNNKAQEASQAINRLMDSLVFVSDDDIETAMPTSKNATVRHTKTAQKKG